jgi:glycosyltransferase involved in cell wall biosynthesis
MAQFPRISIVTPSFNQAKYLPETIQSILNQGYPNLEYIIVDGGSTDGSVDIIKRYESHLSYWVSEKDSGQSEAINKGFRKATGELFNWINSDDILFPGALQRLAEAYLRNPGAALVYGDHARADRDAHILRVSAVPSSSVVRPERWVFPFGQQSTFLASQFFARVGGVREDLHCIMDMDLYYRIFAAGGTCARARGFIGLIREHPECKGVARIAEWDGETTRVYEEYGISKEAHRRGKRQVRWRRLVDGSLFRSYLLTRQWKGRAPWNGCTGGLNR